MTQLRSIHALAGIALSLSVIAVGCTGEGDDPGAKDDEYGMDGPIVPSPPPGKDDSLNRRGLWVNTNTRSTQVWSARNKWEDTDTAAARKAGMAWSENSGLNWDQKYSRWIDSMPRVPGLSYFDTFEISTPWGKTLPSPNLECAEMSMFLRATFSAWYELPFFLEARDSSGVRVFFGHNGVRTANGRYKNTANYGTKYKDYSKLTPAEYQASWPTDAKLRKRKLYGGEDTQEMIAPDAVFGTYLDELHLNKRAGYFTALLVNYLGSVNLGDPNNAYNIVPEAVRPGDTLIERWQRRGIGHTLVVKSVLTIGEGNLDVTVVSGSMPRRQGKWESGVRSKQYFTSAYTGGEGTNSDGREYAKLGGGIKRYRVTKNIGGYWTNTFMRADEAHWIRSTDYERIRARPARFEQMLGQVPPEQLRDELVSQIQDARRHLQNYPASCAARERRENGFRQLYDLGERDLGMTRSQIDGLYRDKMDYVLAELVYNKSKTCCWNRSTSAMYGVISDFAQAEIDAGVANSMCVAPTVFMSHSDGYGRWKQFAEARGDGGVWRPWTEDESCSQRNTAADTETNHEWTAFCSLPSSGGGGTPVCSDELEPNNGQGSAASLAVGDSESLEICDGDADWFSISGAAAVSISFTHDDGDLDMRGYDASGNRVGISQSISDAESLSESNMAFVEVYGYNGATGRYTITVE